MQNLHSKGFAKFFRKHLQKIPVFSKIEGRGIVSYPK